MGLLKFFYRNKIKDEVIALSGIEQIADNFIKYYDDKVIITRNWNKIFFEGNNSRKQFNNYTLDVLKSSKSWKQIEYNTALYFQFMSDYSEIYYNDIPDEVMINNHMFSVDKMLAESQITECFNNVVSHSKIASVAPVVCVSYSSDTGRSTEVKKLYIAPMDLEKTVPSFWSTLSKGGDIIEDVFRESIQKLSDKANKIIELIWSDSKKDIKNILMKYKKLIISERLRVNKCIVSAVYNDAYLRGSDSDELIAKYTTRYKITSRKFYEILITNVNNKKLNGDKILIDRTGSVVHKRQRARIPKITFEPLYSGQKWDEVPVSLDLNWDWDKVSDLGLNAKNLSQLKFYHMSSYMKLSRLNLLKKIPNASKSTVYIVYNKSKDMFYIGQAEHGITDRWEHHMKSVYNGLYKNGSTTNGSYQWVWDCIVNDDESYFSFLNLDNPLTGDYDSLDELEHALIWIFDSYHNGYNQTRGNGVLKNSHGDVLRE